MKKNLLAKTFYSVFFTLLFLILPVSNTKAAEVEQIRLFKSDISVAQDTTINIREEIHYYFSNERHGIYWEIPIDYKVEGSFKRPTKFTLNDLYYYKVGQEIPKLSNYEKSRTNGYVTLKIGDADKYISGDYVFVIDYSLKYANNYFDDHDEIYLNVIGPGWSVPIRKAYADIYMPGEITDKICYTGSLDSTEQNCSFTDISDKKVKLEITEGLSTYEGYTFAVSMPKGTLEDTRDEQKILFILSNIGLLLPIPVLVAGLMIVNKKGKNKKLTVIPHYNAPKGINPSFAGFIFKNNLQVKYITADIIDLAIKGYLKIKQVKKNNYELIRTDKKDSDLPTEQQQLLEGLFKDGDTVNTKKLNTKFYTTVSKIRSTLVSRMTTESMYSPEKSKLKDRFGTFGGLLIILSFFILGIAIENAGIGWFLGLVISGVILITLSSVVDKRSIKGNEMYHELLGLRMYIDTAEKHRIEFHDNPEKFRGVFEKLLPYAILFNLEKKWAKEFEDIYKEPPSWYEGYPNTFNTYLLTRSITSMHRNVQTKASPPGSSTGYRSSHGASGGSGFSGGSSGGGFGGSGGGSW